eukprot:1161641-Pelagomonas_calceolata.AAC.6
MSSGSLLTMTAPGRMGPEVQACTQQSGWQNQDGQNKKGSSPIQSNLCHTGPKAQKTALLKATTLLASSGRGREGQNQGYGWTCRVFQACQAASLNPPRLG